MLMLLRPCEEQPERSGSEPDFFRQPHFGFVEDLFETGKAGKGKPVGGDGADADHSACLLRRGR